jgi:phospholipase C
MQFKLYPNITPRHRPDETLAAFRQLKKSRPGILPAILIGLAVAAVTPADATPTQHHISAANIVVLQNDTNNTTASVTVTASLAINDFRIRPGSNRADYDVQIGDEATDDVLNGILISSIDQNGRDNGEEDTFPGMNYGTSAIDSNASTSPGSSGEYWIPVFQVPKNAEYNFNVAAAYFPYTNGWYGGWLNNSGGTNGGANNHFIGNPSLVLGTHVIDQGHGKTTVNLLPFGLDSRSNAVLLVVGGKNEANFALSAANPDGTWTVFCHDDNVNGGSYEQDYIGFVCVPLTNHTVVSGKFMGDASIAMESEPFKVTNPGIGTYHLSIPGVNPANGVLIISAEGGGTYNVDNIVSYQTNLDGWDVQTRDLTVGVTPALQNLPSTNAVVSFVYIPGPTPDSLLWSGSPTNNWDLLGSNVWRTADGNAPTNYADGSQTIFDDTASNFIVNVAASVAPYGVIVSNTAKDYVFSGGGTITGTTGLIKQGGGKLTLDTANEYTGDTTILQGTLTLGSDQAIPSGAGHGNVMVNGALDLAGFNCAVNNLSGTGTVDNYAAGGMVKLDVNETANTTFSGDLKNSTGSLSLTLSGGGALSLAGVNSFDGDCTVNNGTLTVNGSLGAGQVDIQADGELAGAGTVNGPMILADNSSLELIANLPLTVGALTLNGSVNVIVSGYVSLTSAATYVLLKHGAESGSGSFTLVPPPGLSCNGFTATLNDTGTQLQLVVAPAGTTGTIADVRHVVILMDENRSFDHYFGTFHGVHGFEDRNALRFTNQTSDFYQPSGSGSELPFHTSIQCLTDLNHSWPVTHDAIDSGKNDQWVPNKGAETMAYYDRSDLPYYYALADAYTICDEYHCSVLSSTYPNRVSLMTGMIDPNSTGGGPEIDNSELASGFTWKTYPELLQQAGITWKVFLVAGDSSDNVLPLFAAYKQSHPGEALYDRGRASFPSLAALVNGFQDDVASNTLPSVSWIIGPSAYTEHPPYSPANGEMLTKELLDALAANPAVYQSTVFILNYDENDGFFDHALPILPPAGTPDEFVGGLPIGLGVRVPAIIVSPWTRGGRVCSQVFDHTSIIRFLEKWTGVKDPNISAWRRQVCGDLTSAFDFAHPNPDYPSLPGVSGITCPSGETPDVPSPQTVPTQESGTLEPLPLPYQPNAFCTLNLGANSFTITMTNSGAASFHFAIYPNAYRNDGPWPFDVDTDGSASDSFSVAATGGKYDFSCYGPDGFQRRFAGNLNADYHHIEAVAFLNPDIAGLKIELANSSTAPVTFTVTNGYVADGLASYIVPADSTNVVNIGSETNNGLYDVTVTASADPDFNRGFLGRVEKVAPLIISGSKLLADANFQFTFSGPAGQPYRVMTTTNLSQADSWSEVASGYFGADPAVFIKTNIPGQSMRFYRVVSP